MHCRQYLQYSLKSILPVPFGYNYTNLNIFQGPCTQYTTSPFVIISVTNKRLIYAKHNSILFRIISYMFWLVTKPSSSPNYHGVGPLVDLFRLTHPEVSSMFSPGSGVSRGVGVFKPPPPKSWRPSKIVPNSTRLWKLLKIAEFRTPAHQDVRKKGSKILKLPRFAIVLH